MAYAIFEGWAKLSVGERLVLLTMAWLRIQSGDPSEPRQHIERVQFHTGLSLNEFTREIRKLDRKQLIAYGQAFPNDLGIIAFKGRARSLELMIKTRTQVEVVTRVMPDA